MSLEVTVMKSTTSSNDMRTILHDNMRKYWSVPLLGTVLFLFSAAIAGVNPMSTGMTGKSMSPESMGILLPIAACGGILMPAVIGFAANQFGLQAGMLTNLVPCLGIMILGGILRKEAI